jgi:hypothetical protein
MIRTSINTGLGRACVKSGTNFGKNYSSQAKDINKFAAQESAIFFYLNLSYNQWNRRFRHMYISSSYFLQVSCFAITQDTIHML